MRHPDLQPIPQRVLEDALRRTPLSHHVVWTGQPGVGRPDSLRARAFACVPEIGVPIPLRMLMQRAARLDGQTGLHPDSVRSAVRQHQVAKPAVLFLVEKAPSGDYVAVSDIPYAGATNRRIRQGEVVLDRLGRPSFELLATAA